WGATSLDCPPLAGGLIAALGIDLTNTTGTKTRTLATTSPTCRAPGFTALRCQCDTCNNSGAQACAANADCPVSCRCSGGTVGGIACAAGAQCAGGGPCGGGPCPVGTECGSGSCVGVFCPPPAGICGGSAGTRCAGGTNAGAPCSATSQCPGSACN